MRISIKGRYKPTPKRIKQLIRFVKGIAGAVSISTVLSANPYVAVASLLIAIVSTEFLTCFYEDEEKDKEETNV